MGCGSSRFSERVGLASALVLFRAGIAAGARTPCPPAKLKPVRARLGHLTDLGGLTWPPALRAAGRRPGPPIGEFSRRAKSARSSGTQKKKGRFRFVTKASLSELGEREGVSEVGIDAELVT